MEFTPSNTSPLWEGDHLSEDALARWRNHTLSPAQVVAVSEHLAVCEQCRDQLAAPTALLLLAQALDNGGDELALVREPALQHLNFEQMEAFVDELLTPAGRRNAERHLAICGVCSAQVADLRAVQRDLRDWQISSQSVPEAVSLASTSTNGVGPNHDAAPASAPASVVPPMRVALPAAREKSRSGWWDRLRNMQRYLLPLETAGVVAAGLFLFLVFPYQQELARQKALVDAAIARGQNQSKDSDAQIRQLRNSVASLYKQGATTQQKVGQLSKDKTALTSKFNDTQAQLRATQSKLGEAMSALEEQRRRDAERSDGRSSTSPSPVIPRPTSLPQNAAPSSNSGVQMYSDGSGVVIRSQDGRALRVSNAQALPDDAARVLSQGLLTPDSVKALRSVASTSREAATQIHFSLLSPVTTRVREVRPVLRWEAVPGADSYRVTLIDETDNVRFWGSDPLTQPQCRVEKPLIRGHRYSWRVEAFKQDQSTGKLRLLGDAPHEPDLEAKFELLPQNEEDALQSDLDAVKDSPLQKSVVLAKVGVMDEARQQLSLVIGPKALRRHNSSDSQPK